MEKRTLTINEQTIDYEVFKLNSNDLEDLEREVSFDGNLDDDDAFNEFMDWGNESSYICDAISEIADNQTAIYNSDLWEHAKYNEEYIGEAISEGLVDTSNFDLMKLFQAGEYEYYNTCLYQNLDNLCTNWILRKCDEVEIAYYYKGNENEELTFGDLIQLILGKIDENVDQCNVDNNNRFYDLVANRDTMFAELLSDLTNKNLFICVADDFEDLYEEWLEEYSEEEDEDVNNES